MGDGHRADFTLTLKCSGFKPAEDDNRITGNDKLLFSDVPADAWFAPYVATVSRRNILTSLNRISVSAASEVRWSMVSSLAIRSEAVGWVERSETHHLPRGPSDGFRKRSTHPTSW